MKLSIKNAGWSGVIFFAAAAVMIALVVPQVAAAPPTAVDDTASAQPGETIVIDVLDNDTDPDGGDLEVTDVIVSAEGIQPDCELDGTCTYQAFDGPNYTDTFEYQVQDSDGEIDTGVVTVTVQGDPTEVDSPSSVTLKYKKGAFKGKVTSEATECVAGRKVTVKKGTKKIGSDITNDAGKFRIPKKDPKPGTYKAKVKRSMVDAGAFIYDCGAASKSLKL